MTTRAELWRTKPTATTPGWGQIEIVATQPGATRQYPMTALCGNQVTKYTHSNRGNGFRGWIALVCPTCEVAYIDAARSSPTLTSQEWHTSRSQ